MPEGDPRGKPQCYKEQREEDLLETIYDAAILLLQVVTKGEFNYYEASVVLMLALPLMLMLYVLHTVPGSSASDGVHKWDDCIHSVEEGGDRRGE